MALVTDNIQDFVKRVQPTPEKPTPSLKGVDFFKDTHAKGFIIGKNPTDSDFILDGFPRLKDVDFFKNTHAKGFVLRKNSKDSDFILDSLPRTNFLDTRGNVSLPFDDKNTFKTFINNNESRLLSLHNKDNFLDNYYSQLTSNGRLGIRSDGISQIGFEQPFIVREVGNKLGFDGVENIPGLKNNTLAKVLDFSLNLIDDVGSSVLGRAPNEYIGSAFNSVERTLKFLATSKGAGFLLKQKVLIRRNPSAVRADVRYEITNDIGKKIQNIQKYNPLSLGSLPGVTRISIYAPDPFLPVTNYLNTIAKKISLDAVLSSQTVQDKVVDIGLGVASKVGNYLKKTKIGGGIANFVNDKIVAPVTEKLEITEEKLKKREAQIKRASEVYDVYKQASNALLDKESFTAIDPRAAADVGVDKVNLIPIANRAQAKKDGKTEEELDFIPFSFKDVNHDKYIVFRAILSGITDTFSPEYSSERYVGRPDNVYVYQGTTREISFTFDIYPKSDKELPILWEKMNYLAGLTYPSLTPASGGGQGMISPICELTIGDMYRDTPGYISGLTYTVQDSSTWEIGFTKVPKYMQANVTFVYIGNYQLGTSPDGPQKLYDVDWVAGKSYVSDDIFADPRIQAALSLTGELLPKSFKKKLSFD